MTPIVGRDAEWSVIDAFLGRAAAGPRALLIEGAAGIGKSTLWLAAVEAARERGCTAGSARARRSCEPSSAEGTTRSRS